MEDLMLSVAVLTYNQEKWVSQALESIISQEHDYKYEIIVGDDFSTDGTRPIIKKYADKYPEIIKPIFNEQNVGLIKNYFNVIDHCKGKYIMGLAGDDYWLPEKVATQIEFMESHPDVDMCYGKARVWDEEKGEVFKKCPELGVYRKDFEDVLLNENIPALTVCFRREKVLAYVAAENPVQKNWQTEDLPMWIWISKNGKISFIDNFLAEYRVITGSIAHPKSIEKQIDFKKYIYGMKKYFACSRELSKKVDIMMFPIFLDLYKQANDESNYLKTYRKLQLRLFTAKSLARYVVSLLPVFKQRIFMFGKIRK